MKCIMYHYVQKVDNRFKRLKILEIDNFRKQLDFFEKNFGFVKQSDFKLALQKKDFVPSGVVLTFDDGLKCHFTEVYHELKSRNLWGIFYINSLPLESKTYLDVHKTHLLLSCYDPKNVFECAVSIIGEITDNKKHTYDTKTYLKQINDDYSLKFKRLINYYLNINEKHDLLNRLCLQFPIEAVISPDEFYLNKKEIEEMQHNGMIIGGHTHSHPLLSKLLFSEQEEEIISSLNFLSDKKYLDTFCYPYGGKVSYNKDTLTILNKTKVKYSFTVESRDVEVSDLNSNIQELPRYDCNEFPFGKIPKVAI